LLWALWSRAATSLACWTSSSVERQKAAGHTADGHGDVQVAGDAEQIVFHAMGRDLRAQMDADGLARERLNLSAERVVEHRLHPRSPAHPAGFVERHIFTCDDRGSFGPQRSRVQLGVVRDTASQRRAHGIYGQPA
jgi:hypothetical protein